MCGVELFPLLPSIALFFVCSRLPGKTLVVVWMFCVHRRGETNKNVLTEIDVFSILETEGKWEEGEKGWEAQGLLRL